MAVLRFVVERGAALHDLLQLRGVEFFVLAGGAPDFFGERERGAAVAVGHADELFARLLIQRQLAAFDLLGARQQLLDRRRVERLEHQHSGTRQQRRVQFETRIFGGGADQNDGAVFHHRQEAVLLGAVEAVNLVDEQQRALPGLAAAARLLEHLLQVRDAGEDRGDLLEMQVGRLRQKPRHRGLAGAGRAPEHEAAERARRQHAGKRAVGPEQMILPDHLVELLRAQPVGKRARRVLVEAGGGEQSRSGFGAWRHPLNTAEICWPPRRMMTRQVRLGVPVARSRSRVLAIFSPLTATMTSPRRKPTLLA